MAERNTEGAKEEGWFKRTLHRLFSDDLFMESCFNSIGAMVIFGAGLLMRANKVEDVAM